MFDTHSIARTLSEANLSRHRWTRSPRRSVRRQTMVITSRPSSSRSGLAELRTEIAGLRADLTWRMLAVAGLVIAALRLF